MSGTEFRLLGAVAAQRDGRALALGGPRQRAVLALLLLEPGRPVSIDRLVEELWAGEPPAGAAETVPTYISRLRSALGEAARIAASAAGYAIEVEPEAIDARRFGSLVGEAEAALGRGLPARARELASLALALWAGTPFGSLATDGSLKVEAERLEELRLRAIELRLEADLALGAGAGLVDEVEALVREHPIRERLWEHLMLALYRAGRQAEALDAYRRAREQLSEQLGLEPGEALQRLQGQILRHEVPAPEATGPSPSLPAPLTSFVGRADDLAEVSRALQAHRLVTLTGVGGVGKTRLAIEVARAAAAGAPDGAFFIDLSALRDPALVPRQVAAALEVREQPGTEPIDALTRHLEAREVLLVLDNCEHLARACAELATAVLARCPLARVLATSRELLGVPGEAGVAVQPLQLPGDGSSGEEARASDAVGLFLARAREVRPGLVVDDAALGRAAEICRELDGLPLAIELAAARAKVLSLDEIAVRLRERFEFLVASRRLSTERHRTLRRAMDWSYDLLEPDEQALLADLSVFAGGCIERAVAEVCLDGDGDQAARLLDRLAGASLVQRVAGPGETRYRLLETVRQYGAELLEARGDREALRRRHAGHFRALLDSAWAAIRIGETAPWTERLGRELDNIRAALAWARDAGATDELLRLAEGMWYFWWVHGDVIEGRAWLAVALDRAHDADPRLRARGLHGAARLAWAATDFRAALALAEAALAALPDDAPAHERGMVFQTLGVISTALENRPAARGWLERARSHFLSLPEDDPWRRDRLAGVTIVLGTVAFFDADYGRAMELYREGLADCVDRQDADGVALCELYMAHVDLLEGRPATALALLRSALRHYRVVGWLQYITECLELTAFAGQALGRPLAAVRLVGAADALRSRTAHPATLALARLRDEHLPELRDALGIAAFERELATGRTLPDERIFAEAEQLADELAAAPTTLEAASRG